MCIMVLGGLYARGRESMYMMFGSELNVVVSVYEGPHDPAQGILSSHPTGSDNTIDIYRNYGVRLAEVDSVGVQLIGQNHPAF